MTSVHKWSLSMHQIECCNCSHGCGCQFAGFPDSDTGGCEALLGFYVKDGQFGDMSLKDVKIVLAASWPKAIHEGGGTGILFIDSKASSDQVTSIATIFSGQAGGMPFEALSGTFSQIEGPIIKNIEMDTNERRASFSIQDVVSVQHTPLINPVTGEEQNVHITFPDGGFLWNDGNIGTTSEMSINHPLLTFEHIGNFAAKADVTWSN